MTSYTSTIDDAANQYGVPPNLLTAVLQQESSFNPNDGSYNTAVVPYSSSGPAGIAQFMPGTAQDVGVDTGDITSSINGAAAYLSQLFNSNGGSWTQAVQSYGTVPSTGATTAGQQAVMNQAQSADGSLTGGMNPDTGAPIDPTLTPGGSTLSQNGASASQAATGWVQTILNYVTGGALRVFVAIFAIIFVIIGLASLALKSAPTKVVTSAVKGIVP